MIHILIQGGCQQAGKQIFREGHEIPGRQEVEHELAKCFCDRKGPTETSQLMVITEVYKM